MDIEKIKSNLQMKNFYFPEASIRRAQNVTSGKLSVDITKTIEKIGEHEYNVTVCLTIDNKDMINLVIKANAIFEFIAEDTHDEAELINKNTVAIMFPFIRSQVSLLTTQPGMAPVVLPTINTAKLIEKQ